MATESRRLTVELRGNARSFIATMQNARGHLRSFAQEAQQHTQAMAASARAGQGAMRAYTNVGRSAQGAARGTSTFATQTQQATRTTQNLSRQAQQAGGRIIVLGDQSAHTGRNVRDLTQGATRGFTRMQQPITAAGQRLRDVRQGVDSVQRLSQRASGSVQNLGTQSQRASGLIVSGFSRAQRPVTQAGQSIRQARESTTQMGAAAQTATTRTRNFGRSTQRSMQQTRQGVQEAADATSSFMRDELNPITSFIGFTMLGQQARRMGMTIGAALGGTVAAFAQFEDSFAHVQRTTQATEAEYRNLADSIRAVAREVPITVTELNQVAGVAGQLGVEVENIDSFTDSMARMGVATNVTSEQAALFQARIGAVMNLDFGEDMERLSSTVVDLGNNFAAREDEIFRFIERIAAAGQVTGMTADEVASFSAAFTAVGVRAERGGTAFQRVLFEMMDQVDEAGEGLELIADTAGSTAEEFARVFREDPTEAMLQFIEGLDAAGNDANRIMTELFGNNVRTTQSFLALAGAGDLAREAVERGNTAWNQNVALMEESETRFATFLNQLGILRNRLVDVAIEIGERLAPIVEGVVNTVVTLGEQFGRLPAPIQNFVLSLGALATAIGVVGGSMAMMVFPMNVLRNNIIPTLQTQFARLTASTQTLSAAQTASATAATAQARGFSAIGTAAAANIGPFQRTTAAMGNMVGAAGRAVTTLGRLLLSFGKFAVVAATVYGAFRLISAGLEMVRSDAVEAEEATEQLALSMDEQLGAAPQLGGEEMFDDSAHREFIEANEELIDSLVEMDYWQQRLTLTQITLQLVRRGVDPEDTMSAIERIQDVANIDVDLAVNFDEGQARLDLEALSHDIGNALDDLTFEGRDNVVTQFVDEEARQEIDDIADMIGNELVMNTEEGIGAMQAFYDAVRASGEDDPLATPINNFQHSFETLLESMELNSEQASDIMDRTMDNIAESGRRAADLEFTEFVQEIADTLMETGEMTDELLPIFRQMGVEFDSTTMSAYNLAKGHDLASRSIINLTSSSELASDAAGQHSDAMEEQEERAESLREAAEEAAERLGDMASEAMADELAAQVEPAEQAINDLNSAIQNVDDDENPLSNVIQEAQEDAENFIAFTREMRDAGVADWITGVIQDAGPEAIRQAREMGPETVEEMVGGMEDAFREQGDLTIDPEVSFVEEELGADEILSALDSGIERVRRENEARDWLQSMGLSDIEMDALDRMFEEFPGGVSEAVAAMMDDEDGMGRLQRELPQMIWQAKGAADKELTKWEGNFSGKGAQAAAGLMSELEPIDGVTFDSAIQIATSEAEGEVMSLSEALEEMDDNIQDEIQTQINTGDSEAALQTFIEWAQEQDVRIDPETHTSEAEEALSELTMEERQALIGAGPGDFDPAESALSELTHAERQSLIDAIAQTGVAESDLQYLTRPREVIIRANVDRVNQAVRQHEAGGPVTGLNRGGEVRPLGGHRGPNRDSMLAALTPGEFVFQRSAVDALGVNTLERINREGALPRNSGGVVPGFNTGGILSDDDPSSAISIDWANAHRPFWTSQFEDADGSDEMRRILDQQDRQLTLMEREQRRRELESDIREAREEHGAGSEEVQDAIDRLNEFEEQVRREDVRQHIQDRIEAVEEQEDRERELAENREEFHDQRRPAELHLQVLNERIAAEERYTQEWMALVDEREQLAQQELQSLNQMLDEEERIKNEKAELEEQLNDDIADLREQRQRDEEQALEDRSDSLDQFFTPLERKENEWGNTVGAVTDNIREQIDAFGDWSENLQALQDRGLDDETIQQLGLDDPDNAATVAMFTQATDAELDKLNRTVEDQMRSVNDRTTREQETMFGELGENLREIQSDFNEDLNDLQTNFNERQKELRAELQAIGQENARGFGEAIEESLRSSIPSVREAGQELQDAMRGAQDSGTGIVGGESEYTGDPAPQGELLEYPDADNRYQRYWLRIGGGYYQATGPGQVREALRVYGPPSGTISNPWSQKDGRLVDYFGPGVLDKMDPPRQQGYDSGGILPPGLTLAYNGTRRAEYVAKPMGRNDVQGGADSQPVTVVVENHIDGEPIEKVVTKRQMDKDRQVRVKAGR